MSAKPKDGDPAFPGTGKGDDGRIYAYPGMSLRDWFAGQALAGFAANASAPAFSDSERGCQFFVMALAAYEMADAMLAESSAS